MKPNRKKPTPTKPANEQLDPELIDQTLAAELRRLKKAVGKAAHAFESEKDPMTKEILRRTWSALSKDMVALARVQPAADKAAGDVLPIAEVEATWTRTIKEFRAGLDDVPARVAGNAMFARNDRVEVQQLIKWEIDAVLARLAGEPPPLPPTAYVGPSDGRDPKHAAYHGLYDALCEKYGNKKPLTWSKEDRALLKSKRQ